jgi:hypothetical protein
VCPGIKITALFMGLFLMAAGVTSTWSASSSGAARGEAIMAKATIEAVLSRHAAALLAVPGVAGVAQSRCDGRPCIAVYVLEKTPELAQQIPAALEGYPVVIEATGEIKALSEKRRDRGDQ